MVAPHEIKNPGNLLIHIRNKPLSMEKSMALKREGGDPLGRKGGYAIPDQGCPLSMPMMGYTGHRCVTSVWSVTGGWGEGGCTRCAGLPRITGS